MLERDRLGGIASRIDEVIKLGFADFLKTNGFRRSGRNWHRLDGESWLIVNLQASKWNSGETGQFTVNLGIYVAAVASLSGEAAIIGKPRELQATIRERLGSLAYGRDQWWVIETSSNLSSISADLVEKMRSIGVPWLETHREMSHLVVALRDTPSLVSASAALLVGDRAEATRLLRKAIEDRPAAKQHFTTWAIKNGIAL